MNLLLDRNTIFMVIVVGHLFTAFLICVYWRGRRGNVPLRHFFLAKCLQAMAWLLLVQRGGNTEAGAVSVSNTLLFLGVSLECVAVLGLQQQLGPRTRKLYLALTAVAILCFHLIILVANVENHRIAFASIATSVLLLPPAYRLWQEKRPTPLTRTLGFLFLAISLSFLARGADAALLTGRAMSLFTPSGFQTYSFLSIYLFMISGNTGFVLLLKQKADQAILRFAEMDDLTDTLNRRTFITRANKELAAAARKAEPVSLLLFDVDQFKTINDTFGHDTGDEVLRDLAMRIKPLLSGADGFARYGGDEFAILLPGLDAEASDKRAEQIRQAVERGKDRSLPVEYTISLGVLTVVPEAGTRLEVLYSSCDQALYAAKRKGRNCTFRL